MNGNFKSITIFGSTGDLSCKKLFPSLYQLFKKREIVGLKIVAIGRKSLDNDSFRELVQPWIIEKSRFETSEEDLDAFFKQVLYFKMDIMELKEYQQLKAFYQNHQLNLHLFCYATAPSLFEIITDGIDAMNLSQEMQVMIEKPFGSNLQHANYLNEKLIEVFHSHNVYRIDHYLGKEMIQNILTLRFDNEIFRRCWDKVSIDYIHIQAFEEMGILQRGEYYDQSGALMDMVQNHLMQVLTLVLMDKPKNLSDVKEKQIEILKSLQPIKDVDIMKQVSLKQYEGYRKEAHVDPNSTVETYARLILYVEHPSYNNVPMIIETGKKMECNQFKVEVHFKKHEEAANVLIMDIQPEEGIHFKFNVKRPGLGQGREQVSMNYCQSCQDHFRINTPDAYERLIEACLNHDDAWFSSWQQIALSWEYIDALKQKFLKVSNVEIGG
ncbi:MAG: glucose-6-phosphate dehydrogenase [Erysipelotrichaceae bacterium]